jgi:hypothetical protein
MTIDELAASLTSVERSTLIDYHGDNYKARLRLMRRLANEGHPVRDLQDYLEAQMRGRRP